VAFKDLGRLTYGKFLKLFRHMVGLLGRVISPSQGLYLHRTAQHRKTWTKSMPWVGLELIIPVFERLRPTPQTARPVWSAKRSTSEMLTKIRHSSLETSKVMYVVSNRKRGWKCKEWVRKRLWPFSTVSRSLPRWSEKNTVNLGQDFRCSGRGANWVF
jgi:hypothetical protein